MKLSDLIPSFMGGDEPQVEATGSELRCYTVGQLAAFEHEPQEMVLGPWLPTQGIAMIYAPRGVGKSYVAIGAAVAIAYGKDFLRWSAPRRRRVLFIDGEMSTQALKERFLTTLNGMGLSAADDDFLHILAADAQTDGLPDLSKPAEQSRYASYVEKADVVIVDNLSTLCPSLRENEADAWVPVQNWALQLRRKGKAVLFVHHAGKGGEQRGTSRKEDIMNAVVRLKQPPDYNPEEGCRVEVRFEKARHFFGEDARPFEAWLKNGVWTVSDIRREGSPEDIRSLKKQGYSVREIAERTGMSKSAVGRVLKSGNEDDGDANGDAE
jgi:putative DNA primase/helicase